MHFIPFRSGGHFSFLLMLLYGIGLSIPQQQQLRLLSEGAWELQKCTTKTKIDPAAIPLHWGAIGSIWHFEAEGKAVQTNLTGGREEGQWLLRGRVLQSDVSGAFQEAWIQQLSGSKMVLQMKTEWGCTSYIFQKHSEQPLAKTRKDERH